MNSSKTALKYRILALAAILATGGFYWYQGFVLSRDQFVGFFAGYLVLFGLFYWLWLNHQRFTFNHFLWLAIGFRLVLLLAIPALSTDFFRYMWDGELITHGISPYAHKPDELISYGGFLDEDHMRKLYHGMGEFSQQQFSWHAPLSQVMFVFPAALSNSITVQVLLLKLLIILADVGIIFVGKKILQKLELNTHHIWLFALNPLIILEFTGNLHLEGIMLFFLLCAFYLLLKNQWAFSSLLMAFAVLVKLIPLILVPLFIKKLGLRRMIAYSAVMFLVVMLIGKLFFNELFLLNALGSVDQFFGEVQFNAGLYALVQWMAGEEAMITIGPFFTRTILLAIILLALMRKYRSDKDLFSMAFFAALIFFGFSSVVNPWFISLVLLLSVFTSYRTGLVWSFLVMLSYGIYDPEMKASYFVMTEYVLLAVVLFVELRKNGDRTLFDFQFDKIWGLRS